MNRSLVGKVAFVAGGSRAVGAAIVRCLAREGATVAFTCATFDNTVSALVQAIELSGGQTYAIKADCTEATDVIRAVDMTYAKFGRLDILVNNAGIMIPGSLDDYDLRDFDRMLEVNVRSVFVAAQTASRRMTSGGRIITIGSAAGTRSVATGSSVYRMTAAAVAALTRGLARDLGPRGITVTTVQPGQALPEFGRVDGPLASFGSLGTDDDVARFVTYLAGPDARFITGANLTIDSDYVA
jgi:3-oxoacyl-[acyl-carrier protein] reductase